MATHIVINPDLLTFTTMEKAFLDVAGDPAVAQVTYTVFVAGAQPHTVTVPMNSKNFVTSPDLFGLSLKKAALIVATTSDPGSPSVAVLHQQLGNARVGITVPPSNMMLGTSFNLPVSDLIGGGSLFVGNPSSASATGVVQYGNARSAVSDQVTVPPFGITKVRIQQAEANLMFTVTNETPVVVQAAIGTRFQILMPIGPAV